MSGMSGVGGVGGVGGLSGTGRLRVGVLFGGPSAEHRVSCASALAVLRGLSPDLYEPVVIGVTRQGHFRLLPPEVVAAYRVPRPAGYAIEDGFEAVGSAVELLPARWDSGMLVVRAAAPHDVLAHVDVAFPVMHGPFGEDGVIQGFLETLGVRYVGCGVLASALSMNKVSMKQAFAAEGLPITPHVWSTRKRWRPGLTDGLRWPLFVKPASLGSSIGVSRVPDPGSGPGSGPGPGPGSGEPTLDEAVEAAFRYDDVVIVEEGLQGRELVVGVLSTGAADIRASPVGEIKVAGGWLDYAQKYQSQADSFTVPADLPRETTDEIRRLAVRAFRAVQGHGLARVDFVHDEHTGRPFLLEINTLPGFTARSVYARAFQADGLGYSELLHLLIGSALSREAR